MFITEVLLNILCKICTAPYILHIHNLPKQTMQRSRFIQKTSKKLIASSSNVFMLEMIY